MTSRREFIRTAATGATALVAGTALLGRAVAAEDSEPQVCILFDPSDALLQQPPVRWAVQHLQDTLRNRQVTSKVVAALGDVPRRSECILVARSGSALGLELWKGARAVVGVGPERLGVLRSKLEKRGVLAACGSDVRGVVYAVLELADVANLAAEPLTALRDIEPTVEKPANQIRSVARAFVSDVEDVSWFHDRLFWERYLTMLATQRFNRFSLTLGIGYDFTNGIRDCYFHFPYPFLVAVPGYSVSAVPLLDVEREKNLQTLKFVSAETARRGLHFQLGLWTHAYQWTNSPRANYTIEGLTASNHASYCRDALQMLLSECPAISGVTFRVHGDRKSVV